MQVAMCRPDLISPDDLAMRMMMAPLSLWWALVALAIRRRTAIQAPLE